MEGVKLLGVDEVPSDLSREEWLASEHCERVADDLKTVLEGMVDELFGPVEKRWVEVRARARARVCAAGGAQAARARVWRGAGLGRAHARPPRAAARALQAYFPFTEPSLELEIFFQGDWLEVLGCGVIHSEVLSRCELSHRRGWAFGLGLERLAMILFQVPDIRLFWTTDERFHSQFKSGEVVQFQPYSKFPECYKDVTFWVPEGFEENDFMELCREVRARGRRAGRAGAPGVPATHAPTPPHRPPRPARARGRPQYGGDLMESVKCIDTFTHPKHGRTSMCYRISYRSMDRSLENAEIDEIQFKLRDRVEQALGVELR